MKIIDLTQVIKEGMPVYPGTEGPRIIDANTIKKDGFAEKLINMYSHTGTHIDAPSHIYEKGRSLDEFGVERFVGRAIVIDVEGKKEINLKVLEEINLKGIEFVLFKSGWDKYWGQKRYYEDFPTLTIEAAQWLSNKKLKGIGIDAISLDKVSDEELPIHKMFLGKDHIFVENLKDLDKLLGKKFIFSCLPLKVKDADGSPVRAVAIIE